MMVLLEGESLVNDATGLVLFRFAVAATLTGSFSIGQAVFSFSLLAIGGVIVGLLFGWLSTALLARMREPHLAVIASLLTAWASYIVADRIGTSGVLSTVACGIFVGAKQHAVFTASMRTSAESVWIAVGFVLESLVFVLIGLALRDVMQGLSGTVLPLLPAIAGVVGAVVLSRFVWLFGTIYGRRLFPRARATPPIAIPIVMGWAGMRGVVSLAIALSLPTDMPGRDFILLSTFAVILVTVLVQGSTLGPLIRMLRLRGIVKAPQNMLTEIEARVRLAEAQLATLRQRAYDADGTLLHPRLLEQLEFKLGVMQRVRETEGGIPGARAAHFDLVVATVAAGRRELLRLHRERAIHDSVLRTLETELDLEEMVALRRRGDG